MVSSYRWIDHKGSVSNVQQGYIVAKEGFTKAVLRMATSKFDDVSMFEDTQVPLYISPDKAFEFFEHHGIFYRKYAEVGRLASMLRGQKITPKHMEEFRSILMDDSRLKPILEPFTKNDPTLCFTLGSDAGNFYSLGIGEGQRPVIAVFMWRPDTELEFSHGSHVGPAIARGLKDVPIDLSEGGVLIAHPRLAFQVKSGGGIGFACEKRP